MENSKLAERLEKLNKEYADRQRAACEELVERHFKVFAQKATEVAADGGRKASVRIRLDEVTTLVVERLHKRLEAEGLKKISFENVGSAKPYNSATHLLVSAEW